MDLWFYGFVEIMDFRFYGFLVTKFMDFMDFWSQNSWILWIFGHKIRGFDGFYEF